MGLGGPHNHGAVSTFVAGLAQALAVETDAAGGALVGALFAVRARLASVARVAIALTVDADALVVAVVRALRLLSGGAITAAEARVALAL
jgi:hypothetical protein